MIFELFVCMKKVYVLQDIFERIVQVLVEDAQSWIFLCYDSSVLLWIVCTKQFFEKSSGWYVDRLVDVIYISIDIWVYLLQNLIFQIRLLFCMKSELFILLILSRWRYWLASLKLFFVPLIVPPVLLNVMLSHIGLSK